MKLLDKLSPSRRRHEFPDPAVQRVPAVEPPSERIPALAYPPNWSVVSSSGAAAQQYPEWTLKLGVGAEGPVEFSPIVDRNLLCVSGTGAGKSVLARGLVEQIRAAGGQVILGDGHGLDYYAYRAFHVGAELPVPGVLAGGSGASAGSTDYLATVVLAHQILKQRKHEAAFEKPQLRDLTPLFVILDDAASVRRTWEITRTKRDLAAIDVMVSDLLANGPGVRIHLVVLTHDRIPTSWGQNSQVVLLGRTGPFVARQVSTLLGRELMDGELTLRGHRYPGRGLYLRRGHEPVELQSYFSWAPGETLSPAHGPASAGRHWGSFKESVSDAVPRLYTRQWFKLDRKSKAQLEEEKVTGRDRGFVDLEIFTVEELQGLVRIGLDKRLASGEVVRDPDALKFDPTSDQYVGRRPPEGVRERL
ncbi:Uncharacterised protein (plasmid) [Tsukamurella tyrosinosolvens]|uniref:FtsK domain-containing protein n=1 Tax=Tsukamurella tyrosinosolvens TaxID=57704 RepID=A0A1H4UMR7_TSUTY|nr:hypothetical protein [Tsukamurella tyrosinosolvens]KXO99063.1 hypothetical protein AXK58_24220 [Tsukamurella tyrosinosolvens]SEC69688.1 hypothetical protein SAMN04489793_2947 [Tsukamurella tyrosinosolvens]VEH94342.1 Uncharacterised protein [Tsukamurella tyrosinosolvens]